MTFYIDQIRDEFDKDGNRKLKGCVTPVFQTYYTSHTVGQCYKCPDQPVVYLNTPKCASSFMKTQVLDLGWQQALLDLGPKEVPEDNIKVDVNDLEKIIVVMRDPYDRWLSGIAEYFGEELGDNEGIFELLDHPLALEVIADRVAFDDHSESQLWFLQNVPLEKCVFFRQEQGLNYKISKYFSDVLNIPNKIASESPVHVSTAGTYGGRVKKHLDRLLRKNNVCYMKVLEYMEQDYEFIENMVTFYGD